jgi:hypothetical protein
MEFIHDQFFCSEQDIASQASAFERHGAVSGRDNIHVGGCF